MDSLVQILGVILGSSAATFGGYWAYLRWRKEREATKEDQRVTDLKEYHERERRSWERENTDLRTKLEKAYDLQAQNTTALEESNKNDMVLASLVEQTMKELKALQERR